MWRSLLSALWVCVVIYAVAPKVILAEGEMVSFEIQMVEITGNKIIHDDLLQREVKPFIGKNKTAQDVEKARVVLEKFYHKRGYPTALVNIPEQTIDNGILQLEVIESKVRRVRVTGNRYFTRETLLKQMPAFMPGEVLYMPRVKEQLARVNRNSDLKVAPILMPGKKLGTIDVEFKVKDKLPLHGSLELNNRSTHSTTDLRLNGMLRYDNLWQKEHSIVMQYQTSPEETDEVQMVTGSYGLPSPWNDDHMIAIYALWSDSDTATAGDISVVGKGNVVGLRYMMPLPSSRSYIHDFILGADYKSFDDEIASEITINIDYLPIYAAYSAVIPDGTGQTHFGLGLNFNLRDAGSNTEAFESKRANANGNYVILTAELERDQKLFAGFRGWLKVDGQVSSESLISNEQYSAGGVSSVRGYKESEVAGDHAVHASVELRLPDLGHLMRIGRWLEFTPYAFYDFATVHTKDPLAGEDDEASIAGAGAGVRGHLLKHLTYELNWAKALKDTNDTQDGDSLFHFQVKFQF